MVTFIIAIISICCAYITSQNIKCGSIKCSPGGDPKVCARLISGLSTTPQNNITIYDICNDNEVCDVHLFNSLSDAEVSTEFPCAAKTHDIERYAGEDCNTDDDCWNDPFNPDPVLGHCEVDKKCSGKRLNETCIYNDKVCMAGLYCDDITDTCQPQKGYGEPCENEDWACVNGLICYNKTCSVKPFSFPVGTVLTGDDLMDKINTLLCNFGIYAWNDDISEFICASLNQTTNDEFVKCNYKELCNYTLSGYADYQVECGCGLNPDTQGYCRQGQNLSNINLMFRGAGMAEFLYRAR
jgi:hypothetical protein